MNQEELSNDNFGGMFEISAETEAVAMPTSGGERDKDFYYVSVGHEKAKDRVYTSRIRLLPNVHASKKDEEGNMKHAEYIANHGVTDAAGKKRLDIVSKWIYALEDPDRQNSVFYVDCLSNDPVNNKGIPNLISTAFFELREHNSVALKSKAKRFFSRKMYHWMLALIMRDEQQPDTVGTRKIFRFGKQIDDKRELLRKGDPAAGEKGVVVYDLMKGKDLRLKIEEKSTDNGGKITSYEGSSFSDGLSSISFDGGETRFPEFNKEIATEIREKLVNDDTPDLIEKVGYAGPWGEKLENKIIESIRKTIGDDDMFNFIYRKTYGKDYVGARDVRKESATESVDTATAKAPEKKEEVQENNMDNLQKAVKEEPKVKEKETVSTESTSKDEFQSKDNGTDSVDFDDLP